MSGGDTERSPGSEDRNQANPRNQVRQKEKPGEAEATTEHFPKQQHQHNNVNNNNRTIESMFQMKQQQ